MRKDIRAVSEVVGSVLLLLMTVTVFSGIIIFVNSIQGPGNQTFVDLVPGIDRTDANNGLVTITHAGGKPLSASPADTEIIILVNSTRYAVQVTDGLAPSNGQWVTGQKWQMPFMGGTLSQNATVQVTVIDLINNQIVLLALVQRGIGTGGTFPVIGAGAIIPNGFVLNTGGDLYRLRVIAVDYDNDLPRQGVTVNLGSLGCNLSNVTLTDVGFGVFESNTSAVITSCVPVGDYVVKITAVDLAGHMSNGTMIFQVKSLNTTPPFAGGTGPFGWTFNNQFQAYEIYNSTEWDAKRFNGTPTRNFVKGETVVIALGSQFIKNVDLQNDLLVYGSTSLPVVAEVYGGGVVTGTTHPSSHSAFKFEEFIAGYFLYTGRFSTDSTTYGFNGSQMALGRYTLELTVRANNVAPPLNRFSTADAINITDASGSMPLYPRFEFFHDPALTQIDSHFVFTEVVYVKVTVMDTNAGASFGTVTISDYVGGIQIISPPGNSPITAVSIKNSTVYSFSMDLSAPNGDAWIYGTNAYGIKLNQLIDDNERYALATQIIVDGPKWALDIVSAIQEWGHPVFGTKVYSVFYQNDNAWESSWLEHFDSTPAQKDPDFGGHAFLDVRLGDMDGDDDLDAVVGTESGYVFLYRNVVGDGTLWQRVKVDYLNAKVISVEVGHVDADQFNDVVAGTENGQIWYYHNDGSWIPLSCTRKHPNKECQLPPGSGSSPVLLASFGGGVKIQDLKLADVNQDGYNDIIAALGDKHIKVLLNDGFGFFGTTSTNDYLVSAESAVQGTVTNTYTSTQSSNNAYESIREVNGTGLVYSYYQAIADLTAAFGQVEAGSYANTFAFDGAPYETLSETFSNSGPKWMIRNSTGGASPGHQWSFGTIPTLSGTDTATVTISAFLSGGTEPMEIRYKVGGGAVSSVLGTFSETTMVTKTFTLSGFTGGELYIVVQDSDISNNDANTDAKQTAISIDQVFVTVATASGSTSRLEHKWQTATIGTGGAAYRLFMEANHTTNTEQDDFLVQWGPASTGPWTDAFVVTKTADDDTFQNAILPNTVAGTQIWVRVTDTNRTANASALDTFTADAISVRRYVSTPNTQTISTSDVPLELVLGDMDRDGKNDIVAVMGKGATIYYGSAWTRTTRLDTPFDAFSVDIGHADGNGQLDVVIGSNEQFIYVFYQTNGTYTRTSLVDLSVYKNTVATYIRVGDIDGDGYDDIVIGTRDGDIMIYRHLRNGSWDFQQVETLSKPLYSLDIGDVDRGVTFEYSGRLV